jgi:hypothetical protein
MYVLLLIFAISATEGVGSPAATLLIDDTLSPVVYQVLSDCTKASSIVKSKSANPQGAIKATRCEKIN